MRSAAKSLAFAVPSPGGGEPDCARVASTFASASASLPFHCEILCSSQVSTERSALARATFRDCTRRSAAALAPRAARLESRATKVIVTARDPGDDAIVSRDSNATTASRSGAPAPPASPNWVATALARSGVMSDFGVSRRGRKLGRRPRCAARRAFETGKGRRRRIEQGFGDAGVARRRGDHEDRRADQRRQRRAGDPAPSAAESGHKARRVAPSLFAGHGLHP